ncbi:response regulator [Thalassomonas sp. RHCl1]|uniref:response regulator n=1 Tax=Thalassomonas sp. RHCl1 TaxID=2995320 RepID=UPI00248D0A87|nr:response regulator [Thalassomonas sp. RHCl1]
MNKKFNILFVDDEVNGNRKGLIANINYDERFNVTEYHPVDAIEDLDKGLIEDKYALIIVDYKLSHEPNRNNVSCHSNGYSLTSLFKEKLPNTPVYLISQILTDDISMGEHYDKMFSHSFLTSEKGRDLLAYDCEDHQQLLKEARNLNSFEKICEFLMVPNECKDAFKVALPIEFRKGLSNNLDNNSSQVLDKERSFIRFAKWINQIFLLKSGPLIDELEVAVLFGLDYEYFKTNFRKEYESDLMACEYKGIFAKTNEKKWWSQAVFDFAVSLADEDYISYPWKVVPKKLNVEEKFLSKCALCQENTPECTAFDRDETEGNTKYAAHWSCTVAAEDQVDLAGFNPVLYLDD